MQEAREERGLTLRQVEERTKIRARYLQDLERENFGVLPAVYVLGSLKTYADHLGLDGEAFSTDLKRRLEPDDLPEEPARAADTRDPEGEYEAAPLLTAGFDYLFLGMGLVLISTLAVMTFVFALATNDGPAVSQLREPALPEAPSEIALAGNVLENSDRQPRDEGAPQGAERKKKDERDTNEREDQTGKTSDPAKNKDDKDQPEKAARGTSAASAFDDVAFVPMSPPSSAAPASAAPASAASSANATAPSSPAPATPEPDNLPASPAPVDAVPAAQAPSSSNPGGALSGGGEATPPGGMADAGRISTRVESEVDRALRGNALVR